MLLDLEFRGPHKRLDVWVERKDNFDTNRKNYAKGKLNTKHSFSHNECLCDESYARLRRYEDVVMRPERYAQRI